jgi:hypothetical protein
MSHGGSYFPTPEFMKKRRGFCNIKNDNELCLLYCILMSRYYEKTASSHRHEAKSYKKYMHELKYGGIEFPVDVNNQHEIFKSLEKQNDIKFVVFHFKDGDELSDISLPCIEYNDRGNISNNIVNVVYVENPDEDDRGHYMYVTDIAVFFRESKTNIIDVLIVVVKNIKLML